MWTLCNCVIARRMYYVIFVFEPFHLYFDVCWLFLVMHACYWLSCSVHSMYDDGHSIYFETSLKDAYWGEVTTAVSSQNTVLHSGLSLVVSFQSYCVLAHSCQKCYHITCNDSWDMVIVHGIVILVLTKIQVTVFWLDTAVCIFWV